jgi:hypothetical protein
MATVLGGVAPARGAANIVGYLFGWHPDGLAGDFWLIFNFLGVTMSQKSFAIQIASLVTKALTPDSTSSSRILLCAFCSDRLGEWSRQSPT